MSETPEGPVIRESVSKPSFLKTIEQLTHPLAIYDHGNREIVEHAGDTYKNLKDVPEAYKEHLETELTGIKESLSNINLSPSERLQVRDRYFELCLVIAQKEFGFTPKESQIKAAKIMLDGNIAQMKPGEGKTFALAMAASWTALTGHQAQIRTDKDINVREGFKDMLPFYHALGLSEVYAITSSNEIYKNNAGKPQMLSQGNFNRNLSAQALKGAIVYTDFTVGPHMRLRDDAFKSNRKLLIKPFYARKGNAIYYDEVDRMPSNSPCTIAGKELEYTKSEYGTVSKDMDIMWNALARNPEEYDPQIRPAVIRLHQASEATFDQPGFIQKKGTITLESAAFDQLAFLIMANPDEAEVIRLLEHLGSTHVRNHQIISHEYENALQDIANWLTQNPDMVQQAYLVHHSFKEGVDYEKVYDTDENGDAYVSGITLIQSDSGTSQHQRRFSDLTQQFLERKADVRNISSPTITENSITTMLDAKLAQETGVNIGGCSGTAINRERQFNMLFNQEVVIIAPSGEGEIFELDPAVFQTQEGKYQYIAQCMFDQIRQNLPVMVYERDPEAVQEILNYLKKLGVTKELHVLSAKTEDNVEQTLISSEVVTTLDPRGLNLKLENGLIIFSGMNPQSPDFDEQVTSRLGGNRGSGRYLYVLGPKDAVVSYADANLDEPQDINQLLGRALEKDFNAADTANNLPLQNRHHARKVYDIYRRIQRRNFSTALDGTWHAFRRDMYTWYLRGELKAGLKDKVRPSQFNRLYSQIESIAPKLYLQSSQSLSLTGHIINDTNAIINRFSKELIEYAQGKCAELNMPVPNITQ